MAKRKKQNAEDDREMHNVEAWAEVIQDVLDLVPEELQAEVVALVAAGEERERKKREKDLFITASETDFLATPGVRHHEAVESRGAGVRAPHQQQPSPEGRGGDPVCRS